MMHLLRHEALVTLTFQLAPIFPPQPSAFLEPAPMALNDFGGRPFIA
jgi:hypothetical protein